MGMACGMDENEDNASRDFYENPERKTLLGRYKRR